MSHPFLQQLSEPPGEFLTLGIPVQAFFSLPELQPCLQASILLQADAQVSELLPREEWWAS